MGFDDRKPPAHGTSDDAEFGRGIQTTASCDPSKTLTALIGGKMTRMGVRS
jgi:hypothetical protein